MKQFSADYIFPVSSPPIRNGVIEVDDDGKIKEVKGQKPKVKSEDIRHFAGIIVPGFINAHCHLELSHLKGQVSEKKGMAGFISELVPKRNSFSEEEIKNAIIAAEEEMLANGIVAVGDISNTSHSFEQKAKQNLFYHTFIELFDLNPEKTKEVFEKGKVLLQELKNTPLHPHNLSHPSLDRLGTSSSRGESIVPHAPYTVSEKLFSMINNLAEEITCIHNQESKAEDDLFKKRKGELFDSFSKLGYTLDWITQGKASLHYSLPNLSKSKRIQLVHNTYITKEDIEFVRSQCPIHNTQVYFCTCPNANLYIEDNLPDYNLFLNEKVTIGTDSYASNWSLSLLNEMKTIHMHFPNIHFEKLLQWATGNGAEFLGIEKTYGTIEEGKKPGLNLIENIDLNSFLLNEKTSVRKII